MEGIYINVTNKVIVELNIKGDVNMLKKKLALGLAVMSCVTALALGKPVEVFAASTDDAKVGVSAVDENGVGRGAYASSRIGYVTAQSGLNVRSGPGTGNSKIGFVYYNERVIVESYSDGWYYINYATSSGRKSGWVSAQYIRIVNDGSMES